MKSMFFAVVSLPIFLFFCQSVAGYTETGHSNPSVVERLREECRRHKDLTKDNLVASDVDSSCVALKALYVLERFFETEKPEKTNDESEIDAKLVGTSLRYVKEILESPKEEGRGVETGRQRVRKMMMPLLVGIVLKISTIIPVILGKLTFMGIIALFTSKLSLAILGLLSLKKMWEGQHKHHGGFSASGGLDEHGGFGGGSTRRRTIVVVRGRELGSTPAEDDAQDLAYSAHIPEDNKTKDENKKNQIS